MLRGDTRAVLKLAKQLLSQTGLRQGSLSKAARGYHLAQGNAPRENTPTAILRTAAKATVEQGLEASLDLALSQWQYHEELWLRGDESAKEHVLDAMGLEYTVLSDTRAAIYGEVRVSQLALALHPYSCEIITITEHNENLESYFVNLVGGEHCV